MPDFLTRQARSELMTKVRDRDTTPERDLLDALRKRRLRPATQVEELPGKPDIVLGRARLAVFVDGDFWHGHQWRARGLPNVEAQFEGHPDRDRWTKKIHATVRRDIQQTRALLDGGWRVLRFWESQLGKDGLGEAADLIVQAGRDRVTPAPGWIGALGSSADFFAGIGLMSRGLHEAGWRTRWANDYDATKRRFFMHNRAEDGVELDGRPIQDVPASAVPRVGLMAAGFPCTDLSLAGKGRGIETGPQSSAFFGFADVLGKLRSRRPAFVILENVVGFIHNQDGRGLRLCLETLSDLGYELDAVVIDAARFVPQSRPRLFIVGIRRGADPGPHIAPGKRALPSGHRPAALASFIGRHPELPWLVRDLPPLPDRTLRLTDILDDDATAAWWPADRAEYLRTQVSDRHLASVEDRISSDGVCYATAFRRMRQGVSTAELRFDGVAGCLRTPKGGSAKQILVRADADSWRCRYLSARECAALMGVDGYRLDPEGASETDALFGLGDAVCVPAVRWLVTHRINPVAASLLRGRVLTP